jgi:ankyrin repeat protein
LQLTEIHRSLTAWQEKASSRTIAEANALSSLLLAAPCNVALSDRRSALNTACVGGDAGAVVAMLRIGWDPSFVELSDGMNAFHLAALGCEDDEESQSAVMLALVSWAKGCEKMLLRSLRQHRKQQRRARAGSNAALGQIKIAAVWLTAASRALNHRCHPIVLRPAAAAAAIGDKADGATALHLAALTGNAKATESLLRLEPGLLRLVARARPGGGDAFVTTALEDCKLIQFQALRSAPGQSAGCAAISGSTARCKGLATPIHWASLGGSLEVMQRLVAASSPAQLNAVDETGCSPLMLAAGNDAVEAVQALLEEPAVDICQLFGRPSAAFGCEIRSEPWRRQWTSLHALAYIGAEASAACLRRFAERCCSNARLGCSKRRLVAALATKDTTGQTPAMLARTKGNRRVADLLRDSLQTLNPAPLLLGVSAGAEFRGRPEASPSAVLLPPGPMVTPVSTRRTPPSSPSPSATSDPGADATGERQQRGSVVGPASASPPHRAPLRSSLLALPATASSSSSSADTLTSPQPVSGGFSRA